MNNYRSLYSNLQFERSGLFKVLQEKYTCKDVLYPGCSIHITPSLYFPHVVYVDQSEEAARFFADATPLLEFVNRNKHYKQSAYIRFIHQDYTTPLSEMDGRFDLLLALFAGGISRSCVRYLKTGGYLMTNNHQGDAVDALEDNRLNFKATISFRKGKYQIEENLHEGKIIAQKSGKPYLKQASQGVTYVEKETYFIFECWR